VLALLVPARGLPSGAIPSRRGEGGAGAQSAL